MCPNADTDPDGIHTTALAGYLPARRAEAGDSAGRSIAGGGRLGCWNNATYAPNPAGQYFVPFETTMSIQNPGDAWFWHYDHAFESASQLFDRYDSLSHRHLVNSKTLTGFLL